MTQPFRSRPRVRRQPEEPQEQIVDGVIAEEEEQSLVPYDLPAEGLPPEEPPLTARPARPLRPRPAAHWEIRPALLILSVALVIAGIFFTLLNVASLSAAVREWWPAVLLGAAMLWSLIALIRRDAVAFLGGAGVSGVSISLLIDTQEMAEFRETVVGAILISIGVAIVVRGLLLRPRSYD